MPFDLSRQLYPHPACVQLPCTCTWVFQVLSAITVPCWTSGCGAGYLTMTEMQQHHLEQHQRPVTAPRWLEQACAPSPSHPSKE